MQLAYLVLNLDLLNKGGTVNCLAAAAAAATAAAARQQAAFNT
jgi:hypothetical protein